jgi:hypothetical protein
MIHKHILSNVQFEQSVPPFNCTAILAAPNEPVCYKFMFCAATMAGIIAPSLASKT